MREYTLEFLNTKAEKMFDYLSRPLPEIGSDGYIDELVSRLNFLNKCMVESGEYKSAAEYKIEVVIDGEIGAKIEEIMDGKLTASTINMWVKTKAKDWNRLKNAFDRINSASVHQIDAIRTILSWEKAKANLI